MLRQGLITFVLAAVPLLAAAQSTSSSPTSGAIGLPLPPITPALPPIGLPLPPLGLSPPVDLAPPATRHPGGDRGDHGRPPDNRHRRPPSVVYVAPPYFWEYGVAHSATPGEIVPEPTVQPVVRTGHLRLDIAPPDGLQLYVDGTYIGTSEEVGSDLELEAGTRRIIVEAVGYEPLVLDARIVADRTITYRGALRAIEAPAPIPDARVDPAPPPAERQTFYLIPGCYMGNIPPEQVRLPAGCDTSRVITYRPSR